MSRMGNHLSKQQMLLLENLQNNYRYGFATPTKGELRSLKKMGIICRTSTGGHELTPEADDLIMGKTEPKYWPRYRGDE